MGNNGSTLTENLADLELARREAAKIEPELVPLIEAFLHVARLIARLEVENPDLLDRLQAREVNCTPSRPDWAEPDGFDFWTQGRGDFYLSLSLVSTIPSFLEAFKAEHAEFARWQARREAPRYQA